MLELIFQGFFEWIYGMILEAWEFFSDKLIDLMSMDFAYLQTHIPILPTIRQAMLAVGWALLIGNLVFQAARSMMAGIGFEAEDPKLLFTRSFVFSFLLLASPQICDICLNMTSTVIGIMKLPDAVDIDIIQESAFDGLACAWLLVFICGVIIMFQSFKLLTEMAERYFILAMLTICAPLAFGMGGSRDTADIFTGWCRMYGSMCILMVLNVVFVKMLLSVLSTVPTGLSVLPWMVLVITIVKVAKKADTIIARIGLNPAVTGGGLGRTFPGMLTYMVTRTAMTHATNALGKTLGKDGGSKGAAGGAGAGGPRGGGPGGSHTSPPPAWPGGRSGGASWTGRKKPVTVSAEDWEPEQNAKGTQTTQAAETHTSAKTQTTETAYHGTAQRTQAKPAAQPEQTRKTSVSRDTEHSKTVTRSSFQAAAANSAGRMGTESRGTDNRREKSAERAAGTMQSEKTRLSNVPASAHTQPRSVAPPTKEIGKNTRQSTGTVSQRTDSARLTRHTVSAAKPAATGTVTTVKTRESTVERHGRNVPTVSEATPATGTPAAAQRERAKASNVSIRTGTAGTGEPKTARITQRGERHGRNGTASSTGAAGTGGVISTRRSFAERQSRNTSVRERSAVSTTQTTSPVPAQQERTPVPKAGATDRGRTPPISSGTAGTGAPPSTRLTLREEPHGRSAPSPSEKNVKSEKASDTARQESRRRPSAAPHAGGTAATMRTGTAGTAPAGTGMTQTRRPAQQVGKEAQSGLHSMLGTADKVVSGASSGNSKKATRKSVIKKAGRERNGTK